MKKWLFAFSFMVVQVATILVSCASFLICLRMFGELADLGQAISDKDHDNRIFFATLSVQSIFVGLCISKSKFLGCVMMLGCLVLPWILLASATAVVTWDNNHSKAIETLLVLIFIPALHFAMIAGLSRCLQRLIRPNEDIL